MNQIQQRDAKITRSSDNEERIIEALLVPYNTPTEIMPGYREQFAPGSIRQDETPPLLFRDHEKPIGSIIEISESEEGCQVKARLSKTPLGEETWQLIKDGVLSRMSIGFILLKQETDHSDEELHTVTEAVIREASIVPFPAYPQAAITNHRNQQKEEKETMSDQQFMTREEGEKLTERLDRSDRAASELDRKIEQLASEEDTSSSSTSPLTNFRSFGDYVKSYASTNAEERAEARAAFEGLTSSVTAKIDKPEWLGLIQADMTAKQPVLNIFTHEQNLPDKGLTLQYGRLASSVFNVAKQANEGDPLVHTGALDYNATAVNVETIGGYTSVSRQRIERESDVTVLTDIFSGLAKAYATHIEKRMRQTVTAAASAAEAAPTIKAAPATASDWLAAVLELADAYEDSIFPLDGLLVSPATFLALANLAEERKALQISGAPENKAGTLSVSIPEADLYGLKVVRLPGWDGNHAVGFASSAAVCKESAGAPLQLSDQDITNLTNAYSVYGYAAFYVTAPDAFKAVKLA